MIKVGDYVIVKGLGEETDPVGIVVYTNGWYIYVLVDHGRQGKHLIERYDNELKVIDKKEYFKRLLSNGAEK